jgi:hypothetical protein
MDHIQGPQMPKDKFEVLRATVELEAILAAARMALE